MAASPIMQALVVGANENTATTLATFLKQCGYSAHCVDSGEAALEEAPRLHPDVIFIATAPREAAGKALARRLREISPLSATPLVAVDDVTDHAAQRPPAEYDESLGRPFSLAELSALMVRLERKLASSSDRIQWSRGAAVRSRERNDASREALDEFWRSRADGKDQPQVWLLGCDDVVSAAIAARPATAPATARFSSAEGLLKAMQAQTDLFCRCAVIDATGLPADPIAVVRKLASCRPCFAVIVLVADGDVTVAVRCVQAGALDVIEKSRVPERLCDAIAAAIGKPASPGASTATRALECQLTDAEQRLLTLTAQGMLNKHIARDLDVSLRTVHIRRAELMRKLGVGSRIDLIRIAVEAGL